MDKPIFIIGLVAIIIVSTIIASGPLIPTVSLTKTPETPQYKQYGQGNISIKNVSFPSNGTLSKHDFGAANYDLVVPPAKIHVYSSTGHPAISYSIEITGLDYQQTTVYWIHENKQLDIAMGPATVPSKSITQRQYHATLSLSVRSSTGNRKVATGNITITVVN